MTSKTAAAKRKQPATASPQTFRCGPVTADSIKTAASGERRKPSAFIRERLEEWLQLNGYPVDPV